MEFIKKHRDYFLLIAVACIGYWQVAFFQNTLKWDVIDQYYPWRMFVVQCLREGILPFWNPYEQFGYPMHADPQSGVWYPVVWLFALFGNYTVYSVQLEYMLHVIGGGVGMMLMLRSFNNSHPVSFLLACCYMFCGLYVGNAQHLTFVIAACWLPFVLNTFKNMTEQPAYKHSFLFALYCYLLLSGGYPAFTISVFYVLLIIGSYHVFNLSRSGKKQQLKKFLSVSVTAVMLSVLTAAGLLLSVYQSNGYLARTEGLSYAIASQGPFSPQSLISLLLPLASTKDPSFFGTDISMSSIYVGLLVLIGFFVFLFQRKTKIEKVILGFTIVFLLASFGKYTPVRKWLFDFLPMMDLFRFPSVFRLFVIIGLLLMAASSLSKTLEFKKVKWHIVVLLFITLLSFLVYMFAYDASPFSSSFSSWFSYINNLSFNDAVALQALLQGVVLAALIFIIKSNNSEGKKWRLLVLVSVADMMLAAQLNIPINVINENETNVTASAVDAKGIKNFPVPLLREEKFNNDSTGFVSPFWRNLNLFYKQPAWDGYNSFQLSNYIKFVDHETLRNQQLNNNWLYFSDTLVYFTDSIIPVESLQKGIVYVNAKDKGKLSDEKGSNSSIAINEFKPGCMKATVGVKAISANLTWMQQYYPGWKVFVNGKEVDQVVITDYLFMSLQLPQGNHEVAYCYDNKPVYMAGCITIIMLMLISGGLFYFSFRQNRLNSLPG